MIKQSKNKARFKRVKVLLCLSAAIIFSVLLLTFALNMRNVVVSTGHVQSLKKQDYRSPREATIAIVHKREGDFVHKGEVILTLHDQTLVDNIKQIQRELAQQKGTLRLETAQLRLLRFTPLPENLRHLTVDIKAQKAIVEQSHYALGRAQRLHKKQSISEMQLRRTRLKHIQDSAQLERLNQQQALVNKGLAKARLVQAQENIDLVHIKIDNLKSQLSEKIKKQRACTLNANRDGQLVMTPEESGLRVKQGELLCRIVWDDKKKIRTQIPESDIQEIIKGQRGICYSAHYDMFKVGSFPGRVTRVYPHVKQIGAQPYYPVDIEILEQPHALKLGSSVEVKILTGKKRLIEGVIGL